MKKTLAILALALFIGGISVPVIASNNMNATQITQRDEDPKKKKSDEGEKTEKKADTKKAATKGSDCSSEKKTDCSSKCEGKS